MFTIAALYHFSPVNDLVARQKHIREKCETLGIKGTLLLAPEGINGTIAGSADGVESILHFLKNLPEFAGLETKQSFSPDEPFAKLKVRLKREIVTMGQPDVDPLGAVGHYVEPEDWNGFIRAQDVVVIDTRNDYEVAIGTFEGAIDPKTKSFREFPAWWEENKTRFENQRVAMFCTGGIRCEKSTSFLKSQGVEEVYHLKGGILKYLETVPEEETSWNGECFVFDGRVSVGHGLKIGPHQLCFGCRRPIMPEDVKNEKFELGVSCHQCFDETSADDKARFRERQKQIDLEKQRNIAASA
ncbi:rhodanese-related sulfurtransferase [Planktotalea arctica]|uniref:oxygen-dependent tRNA uridine(34) hydroxylase TrhO n=1 Tax=Planktotalea arctica TaxID=1481893 RepID=UPI000A16F452|nr:rhodanese-related sulfurtransferase [Planktotalea arctica]